MAEQTENTTIVDPWVPIRSPSGSNEGYVRASAVTHCDPQCAQFFVTWIDGRGQRRESVKPYGFDHTEYAKLLGVPYP